MLFELGRTNERLLHESAAAPARETPERRPPQPSAPIRQARRGSRIAGWQIAVELAASAFGATTL
jgi:hypothetical protein